MVKVVTFIICIFHHNLKSLKKNSANHNEHHSLFKKLEDNQMLKPENDGGSQFEFNFQVEWPQFSYAPSYNSVRPKALPGAEKWGTLSVEYVHRAERGRESETMPAEDSNLQCLSSEIQILEVEDDISTTQNECKLWGKLTWVTCTSALPSLYK